MAVREALDLLDALQTLGFNDEAFSRLHHFRLNGTKESIAKFRGYCEKTTSFERDGTNEQVCKRLKFVLDTYRFLGLSHGQLPVFNALADASFHGIPRR